MNQNDPSIKINIRTGTSNRAPIIEDENKISHSYSELSSYIPDSYLELSSNRNNRIISDRIIPDRIIYEFYSMPLDNNYDTLYDMIVNSSLRDTELNRNENIELDINSRHSKITDINSDCSICQKKFQLSERLSTLECSHVFHNSCIMEWGKYNQICPLCRKNIPVKDS